MAEKHARMRKKPHAGLHRFCAATERKYTAKKKSYTFGPTNLPDPDAKAKSDGEKQNILNCPYCDLCFKGTQGLWSHVRLVHATENVSSDQKRIPDR